MFERAVELYKRINPRHEPEESIPLRIGILCAVLISVWSVISQGFFSLETNVGVLAGVLAGYGVSYVRRKKTNYVLKFLLSIALLVVTTVFMYEISSMPYDTRIPLAKLFLWVQVLHSFDIPSRRDLQFSLVSSLILICVAGIMALDMAFFIYLGLYALVALGCLLLFHVREYGLDLRELKIPIFSAGRIVFGLILILFLLSAVLFAAVPRLPGMRVQTMPFSLTRAISSAFGGGVQNQAYPSTGRLPFSPFRYAKDSYPGFSSTLDLRSRGRLSKALMMRVKVTQPVYHRALSFDVYTGKGWERSSRKTQSVRMKIRPPIALPIKDIDNSIGAGEVIATYYIETKHPNVVFAPYQPAFLYFPASAVWIDDYSALTSAFAMDRDVVYSVISRVDSPRIPSLRLARSEIPPEIVKQYTQLPDIPDRVKELSLRVTKGKDNNYDKVIAIMKYLEDNYAYDLGLLGQKDSEDAVDFFLFKEKRGGCDQFSSAFAVMARANGIPTRIATGYTTGTYNPFTGYYEVLAEDAHSWCEVYYPNNGWVLYDPTPGTDIPAVRTSGGSFMFLSVAQYIDKNLGGRFAFVKTGLDRANRIAKAVSRQAASIAAIALAIVVLTLLAALLFIAFHLSKTKRTEAEGGRETETYIDKSPRGMIAVYFKAMAAAFAKSGLARKTSQTPAEYISLLLKAYNLPEIGIVAAGFQEAFYSDHPVEESQAEEARTALDAILESIENMK